MPSDRLVEGSFRLLSGNPTINPWAAVFSDIGVRNFPQRLGNSPE
jgi:hypothetical protein